MLTIVKKPISKSISYNYSVTCQLSSYVIAHVMPTKAEYILSTVFVLLLLHIFYIECYISGVILPFNAAREYQTGGFVKTAYSITNEEEVLLFF